MGRGRVMGADSKIEWTDHTFNPWWGCTKVSPGCDNCYAEALAHRYKHDVWGFGKPRRAMSQAHWRTPFEWNERARKAGRIDKVFCASMADVFDNEAPEHFRDALWHVIRGTPHLAWLLLTKRVGNIPKMLPGDWGAGWANVWLGISVVNDIEAHRDIIKLTNIPARIRFLSIEPMLGPIYRDNWRGLDWIIVGGESGPKARMMNPDWARSIRDQCEAQGVAFFMKQMTKKAPIPDDLLVREFPT